VKDAKASVELRFGDGSIIRAFESCALREAFDDPLSDLRLTARPPRDLIPLYNEKLRKGQLVALLVNGVAQGVQLIQDVDITIGDGGVTFEVCCQSPLCTPYEASANPDYAFSSKTDVPISQVVLDILRPFGFTEVYINAEDDVPARTGKPPKKRRASLDPEAIKHQQCKCQENETAYSMCARIVNRVGLAIRCDIGGRILLSRPRYDQDVSYSLVQDHLLTTRGNRMLDGIHVRSTNKGQFSECVVRGEAKDDATRAKTSLPIARVGLDVFRPTTAPYGKVPLTPLDDGRHSYSSDESVAPYKPRFLKDKSARDSARARSLAKLILGVKAKTAFQITCEVDGWVSQEGLVWSIDTLVRVVVGSLGIDEVMYLLARELRLDRSGGQKTALTLIPLHSLELGDVPQ
jgi:hypothetical protein